jgi:hypothetical protein
MARVLLAVLALGLPVTMQAEQMEQFGDWQIHYVVFPSSFLTPAIANNYGITRAKDVGIVNISVLDQDGNGAPATVSGHATNLLGQMSQLDFREVREGPAVYYLAEIRHTDQEVVRFSFAITPPGAATFDLKFQKKLYWDE